MDTEELLNFIEVVNKMNTSSEVIKWTYTGDDFDKPNAFGYIEIIDDKTDISFIFTENEILINNDGIQLCMEEGFKERRIEKGSPWGYNNWLWEIISKEQMNREITLFKLEEN